MHYTIDSNCIVRQPEKQETMNNSTREYEAQHVKRTTRTPPRELDPRLPHVLRSCRIVGSTAAARF